MSHLQEHWILLTSAGSHAEALIICSKLESHQIKTYVKDHHTSTLLGTGVSGFKVDIYVLMSQYERALDVYYDEQN